jgi:hypothetical protein
VAEESGFQGCEADVTHLFNKREKDINSPWIKAASAICLKLEDAHAEGEWYMALAIRKYFRDDVELRRNAELFLSYFRQKRHFFAKPDTVTMLATAKSPSDFWGWVKLCSVDISHRACCDLFLRFCEGFPGQGAAERMNKSVKYTRSATRNRQEHSVTQAYVQIQNSIKMQASFRKSKVELVPFLQRLRENYKTKRQEIEDRIDEQEEERIAQEEVRMAQEEEVQATLEDANNDEDANCLDEDVYDFFNNFIEENIIAMSEYNSATTSSSH